MKPILRDPPEGPNPDGIANRLRRERDEARRRRDELEAEVKSLRNQLRAERTLLWECASVFEVAPLLRAQNTLAFGATDCGLVPVGLMHKVHASVFACVGGYDPILPGVDPKDWEWKGITAA